VSYQIVAVVVVVDDIEQQSVVEMKNDDVVPVLLHMDDVDDDQDEKDDVEEIRHFVLNYIHDDNFLVFHYLIKNRKIDFLITYFHPSYVLLINHNQELVQMHMVQVLYPMLLL